MKNFRKILYNIFMTVDSTNQIWMQKAVYIICIDIFTYIQCISLYNKFGLLTYNFAYSLNILFKDFLFIQNNLL